MISSMLSHRSMSTVHHFIAQQRCATNGALGKSFGLKLLDSLVSVERHPLEGFHWLAKQRTFNCPSTLRGNNERRTNRRGMSRSVRSRSPASSDTGRLSGTQRRCIECTAYSASTLRLEATGKQLEDHKLRQKDWVFFWESHRDSFPLRRGRCAPSMSTKWHLFGRYFSNFETLKVA